MREASEMLAAFIQCIFSAMSKRRMTNIMEQRERFDQIFVQLNGSADRSGQRRDFVRVGETRSVIVTHIPRKDLHLATQASKGSAMQYPIPIPLKGTAIRMRFFRVFSALALHAEHGVRRQKKMLALLPAHGREIVFQDREFHGFPIIHGQSRESNPPSTQRAIDDSMALSVFEGR